MAEWKEPAGRDANGRFRPGQSGNPAGKQLGTRNRVTRLRELLADGDVDLAAQVLMDQVREGNGVAARFVLDRMFPKPRDRDIDLALPGPEASATLSDMFDRVLWLMARGEITIDEASRIARLIGARSSRPDERVDERADGPRPAAAPAAEPAFDLQTARTGTDAGASRVPSPPLNRHQRRRAAARARAAPPPPAMPPPLTAVA